MFTDNPSLTGGTIAYLRFLLLAAVLAALGTHVWSTIADEVRYD